jgi:hypothetical protein
VNSHSRAKVLSNVGRVFVFIPGINQISNQVYAYMPLGSYFFKNPDPLPTKQILKVNTHPHLLISDLKISRIHIWILPKENNSVGCLSTTRINNGFISRLCYLQIEKEDLFRFI